MTSQFKRLYQYNQWANRLFGQVLKRDAFKNEKIPVLLAHMAAAELIWLNRIDPIEESIPGVWEAMSLDQAMETLEKSNQLWLDFLKEDGDVNETIHYSDTKGNQHSTVLKDIITHVANHGTHHRGQIATLLRQEDIAPPASDFIFFVREMDN